METDKIYGILIDRLDEDIADILVFSNWLYEKEHQGFLTLPKKEVVQALTACRAVVPPEITEALAQEGDYLIWHSAAVPESAPFEWVFEMLQPLIPLIALRITQGLLGRDGISYDISDALLACLHAEME